MAKSSFEDRMFDYFKQKSLPVANAMGSVVRDILVDRNRQPAPSPLEVAPAPEVKPATKKPGRRGRPKKIIIDAVAKTGMESRPSVA